MEELKNQIDELEERLREAEDTKCSARTWSLGRSSARLKERPTGPLKMDEARGTFEEDMETLKSTHPFFLLIPFLSVSLSFSPSVSY